jgi:hypothetical protein
MSIFQRPKIAELDLAMQRLASECPVSRSRSDINIHGRDPHEPVEDEPITKTKPAKEGRDYKLAKH